MTLPNPPYDDFAPKPPYLSLKRGRLDGVIDTTGQGWLPVNVCVVVNGVDVAFLNVMLEIGVRLQMK
ncbi:hypothetical protein OUZ56_017426 [Daphnia magna]|uniref:Uncharacterized protein n=1 Tax=Daphnia magna TaxID=35525 RepID=A0ABR0ASU3_9CRUS|nr:hypothetical protein OUZ56_017426 [Daphnia magna]